MRRMSFLFLLLAMIVAVAGCGEEKQTSANPEKITIKFNGDSTGKLLELNARLAKEFEKETGIKVEIVIGPDNSTERLAAYQRFLSAKSPDVDVLLCDVVWPGLLGEHCVDLGDVINKDEFFPTVIENNTYKGKLVFAPFYSDAPMLYYRTDLLRKYDYAEPPKTWDELEEMATKIMSGERRAGNESFQGFVFQGAAGENLTCDALEWQKSHDGGVIVAPDGTVQVNTEGARAAFARARKWIGTISTQGNLTYKEEESRLVFHNGYAAFMRNWPYVWTIEKSPDSPVHDKFSVSILPGDKGGSAATLGGWNLAVSKYSRHIPEAKKFVAFMTSEKAQSLRAMDGYLPNRPAVYGNEEIAKKVPYFENMKAVFENAVARPSVGTGRYYNQVSAIYYDAVHSILNGDKPVEAALAEAEEKIKARLKE